MFSKPYYRHLPNLGRAALLLFALLAGGAALIWNRWPDLIHDLDSRIVKTYRGGTDRAWAEATRVLQEDRVRGTELLVKLLGSLGSTKKGDRLSPIKRGALELLTAQLLAQQRFVQGIEWAERWVEFDDRDINGQVRLARLLYGGGERRDEGIQILRELLRKFPGDENISEAYIGMLIEQARHTEACGILLDYLRAGAPNSLAALQDWEVFWDVGEGFSQQTRKLVAGEMGEGGTFELNFDIPPDARRLRMDPPPFLRLNMSEPRLAVSRGVPGSALGNILANAASGGLENALGNTVELAGPGFGANQMIWDGTALTVPERRPDSFFFVRLPERDEGRPLQLAVRGEVAAEPAPRVGEGIWEVYWDLGSGFNANQRQPLSIKLLPEGMVELSFSVPFETRHVRIDPPAGSSFGLSRPRLHVLGSEEATVNLWEIPLYFNEMSQGGNVLHVRENARDPYWGWAMRGQAADQQLLVSFKTRLSQPPADWILAVLTLPGMALVERELTMAGDTAILSRLSDARLQALSQSELVLSWKNSQGDHVTGSRVSLGEAANGAIAFEAVLPGEAATSGMRLELPHVVGSSITFEALEASIEGSEVPLNLLGDGANRPSPMFDYDVERQLGDCRVVGGDPRLEVNIPQGMRVNSVRIRGVAR